MPVIPSGESELSTTTTIVDRLVAALDAHAGAWPQDGVWLGNVIEHTRAAIARTVAYALADDRWLYFRIRAEVAEARVILVQEIAPMLSELQQTRAVRGWWWLCKRDVSGPAIRLRAFAAPESRLDVAEQMRVWLTTRRHDFTEPCYEPELLLFGGRHGIYAAHEFFCADSVFLAAWAERAARQTGPLIPEALSLSLMLRILHAAGLDLFECWDVFERVAHKRTFGTPDNERFQPYGRLVSRIISAGHDHVLRLYASLGGRLLAEHLAFLDSFGHRLNTLYAEGLLECGLREFFVPLILFHWNRLLLPPFAHFGLSHAMAQELRRLVRDDEHASSAQE